MRTTVLSIVTLAALAAACGGSSDKRAAPLMPTTGDDGGTPGPVVVTGQPLPDGGSDASPPPPAGPCAPIALTQQSVDGYASDVFTFSDADCSPRVASLVRNDAKDPGGSHGGFLRRYTYVAGGATKTATGTGANGAWNGFGYVVAHYGTGGDDADTHDVNGTWQTVLAGRHHAIHEFRWRIFPNGMPVDVTAHWFFATGRSHPIFSITYDATPSGANVVAADSRAPYGDLGWDNDANGDVEGIGWGDQYKFTTTSPGPVQPMSTWDYTQPNTIPYVVEWSKAVDAEMGLVQTQPWAVTMSGGDYGGGALASDCWTRTSANRGPACSTNPGWTMPTDSMWPYQLNNWELPFVTTSHRMAWGANYGAVGQAAYTSFGRALSGFPYTSYATSIVLGPRSGGDVGATTLDMEHAAQTTLTATKGYVATLGSGGPGRTDAVTFTPAGYSPAYGTWDVDPDNDAATVTFSTPGLSHPILRLRNYMAATPPAHVQLGGRDLTADVDYFVTVDTAETLLWITLNRDVTGTAEISIF